MIVSNDIYEKQTIYCFTKEVASDFNKSTGDDLEKMILNHIKSDIENGIL